MEIASLVITILLAAMVSFSGFGKLRKNPHIVKVVHETIGVPIKYFPLPAAREISGALGLVLGIWCFRKSPIHMVQWSLFPPVLVSGLNSHVSVFL
jgi:hypothetical protein